MARQITIPTDIEIINEETGEALPSMTVTFWRFLIWLLKDPRWGGAEDNLDRREDLKKKFRGRIPGEIVEIGDADWNMLVECIRQPKETIIRPEVASQVAAFRSIVKDAAKI